MEMSRRHTVFWSLREKFGLKIKNWGSIIKLKCNSIGKINIKQKYMITLDLYNKTAGIVG